MEYIAPPLTTEPDDLADEAFAFLEANIPGWLPSEGQLETWLIEAMSLQAAELADVASAVPVAIFGYFGSTVLGLPPDVAVSASATTNWTVRDALGYTIPAGTLIAIPASGSDLVAFETIEDVTVPAGATTATIVCRASEPGADANGLTGVPELIDPLDYVTDITLAGATAGGADAEDPADYLNRLRGLLTTLSPAPILPDDFSIIAKNDPAVARATTIDLHQAGVPEDPATGPDTPIPPASADDVPRCVTVAVVGGDGLSIGKPARQRVADMLDSLREVNFQVYVVDATYTAIDVAFTITTYAGYVGDDVVTRAIAALESYLSPAVFGVPPFGDQEAWINDTHVRYLEVAQVLNNVEGVNYIVALTVNGGTADVALTGSAPLPQPGTITGAAA